MEFIGLALCVTQFISPAAGLSSFLCFLAWELKYESMLMMNKS